MFWQNKWSMVLLLGILGMASQSYAASTQGIGHGLQALGWSELKVGSTMTNDYRLEAKQKIAVRTNASVSILYRELTPAEQNHTALSWKWLVKKSVPATDPSLAGFDDRDLAVHIWFEDTETDGFWKSVRQTFTNILGFPSIGHVLTYTFGGTGERYQMLVNPHHDPDGRIIILRPSGTERHRWFEEKIDFVADFKRAFGKAPPKPRYVAISADSDDTDSQSEARIGRLKFRN